MRTITIPAICLLLASSANVYAQRPSDRLGWLAGCWEMQGRNASVTQEMWLLPAGGTLLGVSRTVRADSVIEFEHMRIREQNDTLVFSAHPSGQQPAEFRASNLAARSVTFENAAHDFPQRISYRAAGTDSLVARIEGLQGDGLHGVDFRYRRIPCTAR